MTADADLFVEPGIADACRYARSGMSVIPVIRKAWPWIGVGRSWLREASQNVSDVVQSFEEVIAHFGTDGLGVGWALELDGYLAIDVDSEERPSWLLDLLAEGGYAVNHTSKPHKLHMIYELPVTMSEVGASTAGFPTQGWGDLRATGGLIVVSGPDRPGFDPGQLDEAQPFRHVEWLSPPGGAVRVSSPEVDAFLVEYVGNEAPQRLREIISWAASQSHGRHHPIMLAAQRRVVCDARAGLFPAADGVKALRSWHLSITDRTSGVEPAIEFAKALPGAVGLATAMTDAEIDQRRMRAGVGPAKAPDAPTDRALALVDGFRATDVGNANRLIAAAAGHLRYVHSWAKWLVYDDGRWIVDFREAMISERAREVARQLFRHGAELDADLRDRHFAWAKASERASSISNMITLARGTPGVLINHEQLDAQPFRLNVRNGTLDLRTGELRPHDPDDLLTGQAPVIYDPSAEAPLWLACVERWQPDPDVRAFLQRALGTALTGQPIEALFVNVGTGSNGKTKFFEAVAAVLGSYAVTPSKGVFVMTKHDDHKTELASLFGARLLVLPETGQADRLNEAQVKNLTGGDRITCRRMREDEWTFRPTHSAFMHSNHRPRVTGTDFGIWRRLRLIPWETTITGSEVDEQLGAKLALEASGILNWLLAGCLEWQARGLDEPDSVRVATAEYRLDEDHVGRFLADCCELRPKAVIRTSALRTLYEQWCADVGEEPISAKRMAPDLRSRGLEQDQIGGTRFWLGVEQRTQP